MRPALWLSLALGAVALGSCVLPSLESRSSASGHGQGGSSSSNASTSSGSGATSSGASSAGGSTSNPFAVDYAIVLAGTGDVHVQSVVTHEDEAYVVGSAAAGLLFDMCSINPGSFLLRLDSTGRCVAGRNLTGLQVARVAFSLQKSNTGPLVAGRIPTPTPLLVDGVNLNGGQGFVLRFDAALKCVKAYQGGLYDISGLDYGVANDTVWISGTDFSHSTVAAGLDAPLGKVVYGVTFTGLPTQSTGQTIAGSKKTGSTVFLGGSEPGTTLGLYRAASTDPKGSSWLDNQATNQAGPVIVRASSVGDRGLFATSFGAGANLELAGIDPTAPVWSKKLTSGLATIHDVSGAPNGAFFVGAHAKSFAFGDGTSVEKPGAGAKDVVLLQLDPSDGALVRGASMGSPAASDQAEGTAVDASADGSRLSVGGDFTGTLAIDGAHTLSSMKGVRAGFVLRLKP